MTLQELLKPERNADESFKAYQHRRKQANDYVKQSVRLVWDSYNRGTYRKAKHGPI